ncbi:hypothetical protein GCM10027431_07950 [Lysobacter rhizosphaerae]
MTDRARSILPAESYSLAELARLLAPLVKEPGESMRNAVDKVRKRLEYAVEHGQLQQLDAGVFSTAQIIPWARKKWPKALGAIPVRQDVDLEAGLAVRDTPTPDVIPGDIDLRREAFMTFFKAIGRLERELAAASAEAEQLRPAAEKYEELRKKLKASAKRPRKGR